MLSTTVCTQSQMPPRGRLTLSDSFVAVGLTLLGFSWLVTEHFLPWVSWHSEVVAFSAVVLLCWVALARCLQIKPPMLIAVPWLSLPFAGLTAVAVVQFAVGTITFFGDVMTVGLYCALCIACVVLGFNTNGMQVNGYWAAREQRPVQWLAIVIAVGAFASAIAGFVQVLGLWEESAWIVRMYEMRRAGGNLGQPNQMATLLVMGGASVTYLHASKKIGVGLSLLTLFVLCLGLAATESRTGALGLMALLLWWQLKRRNVADEISKWAAPAVGFGFLILFLIWPAFLNSMRLFDSVVENRFSLGDVRLALWSQLLEAISQHPLWGWGVLQVAEAHNAVAHAYQVNNPFSYSHNLVLDLAVWVGLPVTIFGVGIAVTWLTRRCQQTVSLVPWYALAVAVPMIVHSMLEFPFAYAYFLAPLMYLLGVLERSSGAKTLIWINSKAVGLAVFVLSGVLVWSSVEYLAIEEDFRIVRFEQLRIGNTPVGQPRPAVILFTQLGALLSGSRIEVTPAMSPEHLEQLKRLALRYPWVATQYRYALALALNGNSREAVRQFQIIRWQQDEKLYQKIKRELRELAQSRYPELRTLELP